MVYNPCDLSLVVSSSALPSDFTVSLAQEINQCQDLSGNQLSTLAQLAGIDASAVSLIEQMNPAMCVSLSSIQHTESQMSFHARGYIHAQRSMFGFTPPDITVPGMEQQISFDGGCAGPTSIPTLQPTQRAPTPHPTSEPTDHEGVPTARPTSEEAVFKQICVGTQCVDLLYEPCNMTLMVSSELLPNNLELSLTQDVRQCVALSQAQLTALGQAAGVEASQLRMIASLDPALCIGLNGISHSGNLMTFHAWLYVHPQSSAFGMQMPDFPVPGMEQQISFDAGCASGGSGGADIPTIKPTNLPSSKPTLSPTLAQDGSPGQIAVLTEVVSFEDISFSEYTGPLKQAYELGFGEAFGAVVHIIYEDDAAGVFSFVEGYSVTSHISRRSTSVSFTLTAPASAQAELAETASHLSTTDLAKSINRVCKDMSDVPTLEPGDIHLVGEPTVSTAPAPPNDSAEEMKGGMNMGVVAGAVVGGLVLLVVLGLFAALYYRKQQLPESEVEMPSFNSTTNIENSHAPIAQLDVGVDDPSEQQENILPHTLDKMINDASASAGNSLATHEDRNTLLTEQPEPNDLTKHENL